MRPVKSEILRLRAEGKSYRQIARELDCSIATISRYIGSGVMERHHAYKRKQQVLPAELKQARGGACEVCGWDRCLPGLAFHHKDPSTKRFEISGSARLHSPALIKEEASRCSLLCHNCHAMVHSGLMSLL